MSSFDLVVPRPVRKIRIADEAERAEQTYEAGFDAGYRAGKLQAEFELKQKMAEQATALRAALDQLAAVHQGLFELVVTHVPQLVLAAVSRLFEHHRFTDEEIQAEVENLIKELALAREITIEVSPQDAEFLKKRFAEAGVSWTQAKVEWKENPAFKAGEYILESDLGMVDGRRLTRLAQLQSHLQT